MQKTVKKPAYMGQHTAASILYESGKWRQVPLLEHNQGRLPPNIIVVGDRRRATSEQTRTTAAQYLEQVVDLVQYGKQLCGDGGRVNLLAGIYRHKNMRIPVTIVETQMGMSAQHINLLEIMCLASPDGYTVPVDERTSVAYPKEGLTVIRVGSCGGINSDYGDKAVPPVIKIGDLVIAESSFGHSGNIYQALGGLDYLSDAAKLRIARRVKELGLSFIDNFLAVYSSLNVVGALSSAAWALVKDGQMDFQTGILVGGNVSKDSLSCEEDCDGAGLAEFLELRRTRNVMSTEMEHLGIGFLAALFSESGIPVQHGLISGVVGALPEHSFYSNPEEKLMAEAAEANAMKVGLLALRNLSMRR